MTTGTSMMDSMAPVAAMAVRMKNAASSIWPPGICANTAGMVMNTSDGPADGAKPKLNTAGKMAMPASSDTDRSASITRVAVAGMFCAAVK